MAVHVSPAPSLSPSPGGWLGEVFLDEEAFSVQRIGRSPKPTRGARLETGYTTQDYRPTSPNSLNDSSYLDAGGVFAPNHPRTNSDLTEMRNQCENENNEVGNEAPRRSSSALGGWLQGRVRAKSPAPRSKSVSPPNQAPNSKVLVDIGEHLAQPSPKASRSPFQKRKKVLKSTTSAGSDVKSPLSQSVSIEVHVQLVGDQGKGSDCHKQLKSSLSCSAVDLIDLS